MIILLIIFLLYKRNFLKKKILKGIEQYIVFIKKRIVYSTYKCLYHFFSQKKKILYHFSPKKKKKEVYTQKKLHINIKGMYINSPRNKLYQQT